MPSARSATKSPVALGREALAVAQRALLQYSSVRSRDDSTLPQLFAILVLRRFFKTDYRGVVQLLADLSDLRKGLYLKKVPHYSTLLLCREAPAKRAAFESLLVAAFARARGRGLIDERPEAVRQACRHVAFDRLLADAGYDAEHNHALCRRELGIRSTVIPINERRPNAPPSGH